MRILLGHCIWSLQYRTADCRVINACQRIEGTQPFSFSSACNSFLSNRLFCVDLVNGINNNNKKYFGRTSFIFAFMGFFFVFVTFYVHFVFVLIGRKASEGKGRFCFLFKSVKQM